MWQKLLAIAWAQWCLTRNRMTRTRAATVVSGIFSVLWYGMYCAFALGLAYALPKATWAQIQQWVPAGLLGMFVFWQFVPLFTLSAGRAFDFSKLQAFPIESDTLFAIEAVLGLTISPEMIITLLGAIAGLSRHPAISPAAPLFLLLYIPFNVLFSVALREFVMRLFRKNRLRELLGILVIALSIAPSYILGTSVGRHSTGKALLVGTVPGTPWHALAMLSTQAFSLMAFAIAIFWVAAAYGLARWQFVRTLHSDSEAVALGPGAASSATRAQGKWADNVGLLGRLAPDPMAALLQKELQSLRRMPRFRVMVGMACVFGMLIGTQIVRHHEHGFMHDYFVPIANVYGFLFLGEVLVWNVFGFDRRAAQLYFAAPVGFATVLRAKNAVAVLFLAIQTVIVLALATLLRVPISMRTIVDDLSVSAVVAIFFLGLGNLTSVMLPKSVDPNQTFRKQASGSVQLWLLLCSLGIAALLGFALLAEYAAGTHWAFWSVAALEFAIGLIVYRLATETAVRRAMREQERLLQTLAGN
jgi:ABC-2 type transport system permease protein